MYILAHFSGAAKSCYYKEFIPLNRRRIGDMNSEELKILNEVQMAQNKRPSMVKDGTNRVWLAAELDGILESRQE